MKFEKNAVRPIRCFVEGWNLIKNQFLLFSGITILAMFVAGSIPVALVGAMFAGLYYVLLKKMDGGNFELKDLFKGLDFFVPTLIVTLILVLPTLIFGGLTVIFCGGLIAATYSPEIVRQESLIYTLFGVFSAFSFLFALVAGTLHALVMFAYPLIVEHNLSGWDAFKLSSRAVWANANGVVGLILIEFVLGLIGFLFFFVGVYLTIPLMFAAVAVAYRQVFPVETIVNPAGSQVN